MIGVIGVGAMGNGIVQTLVREGFGVTAFDIDPEKLAAAGVLGATEAKDGKELVAACDPVFLSLPTSDITVRVLEDQVLPAVREGQTIIDAGTTVASESRRLSALFQGKGVHLIDAPVSGGPQGASTGKLFIFVGGTKEAADAQWPLLAKLGGARLTYCGPSGSGQVVKGVNQLAMGLTQAALIETVSFGVNAGVSADILLEAVGGSDGFRAQFGQVAKRASDGTANGMDAKYAEMKYFLHEAAEKEFPMPILDSVYTWLKKFPESERDNMNRPFAPYWGSLRKRGER